MSEGETENQELKKKTGGKDRLIKAINKGKTRPENPIRFIRKESVDDGGDGTTR